MTASFSLNQPIQGSEGVICRIEGGNDLLRKLMSLGLRKGQTVSIVQQRQSGVVVLSQGNRIALDESVAARVFIELNPAEA
jgi:Fe2+ transport system protein FeoA